MQIVNKKPIPMYEVKCHECGSVFQYKKSEVPFTGFINCPVCGCSNWANTTLPVYNSEEQNNDESTMNQWIPCSERLPEIGQEVLVYAIGKDDGFIGDAVTTISERFIFRLFPSSDGVEEWRSPWQYFSSNYEITHWMPLPDPPKGEQK